MSDRVQPAPRRRPVGRHQASIFHQEAYAFWATGKTIDETAEKFGAGSRTVDEWKRKEKWGELLHEAQVKARTKLIEKEADRLARLGRIHMRGARQMRRYAVGLLKTGAVEVDPMTGKAHLLTKKVTTPEGQEIEVPVGVSYRPLLPAELNQAALAFDRAANLEYGRAGGKAGPGEQSFPDLIVLITKLNAERVSSGKLKSAGHGSTSDPDHPSTDPRYRALEARQQ